MDVSRQKIDRLPHGLGKLVGNIQVKHLYPLCRSAAGLTKQEYAQIADRKGVHFPVRCVCSSCYNVIYNSLPLSLHRFAGQNDPLMFEAGGWVCSFTTESGPRTGQILRAYLRAASHQAADPFGEASGTYTTGHFKKSAL